MIQQINLYQQAVRPVRVRLPARQMAVIAGLFCVALAAYGVFLAGKVDGLEADLAKGTGEAAELQKRLDAFRERASTTTEDPDLRSRMESLQRARDARIQVLEVFSERRVTSTHGFSPALAALARQCMEGLWLRRIVVGNSQRPMLVLEGSSLDPQLLTRYLQRLAGEESLAGFEFTSFALRRADGERGQVDFAMQTTEKVE